MAVEHHFQCLVRHAIYCVRQRECVVTRFHAGDQRLLFQPADLVSDPNNGPHTPNQWVSRSAFQQLNPVTQAGQFGNEGRNVVRGPGIEELTYPFSRISRYARACVFSSLGGCFNLLNHANLGLPENDLQSPAFGQILQSTSPRLLQLALKFLF